MNTTNPATVARARQEEQYWSPEASMDDIAADLNAHLERDFPGVGLNHRHSKTTGPVQHAERLLKEATELATQMAALTTDLVGILPKRAQPTKDATPPMKGVLPQVALLEDAAMASIDEVRALIEHIRGRL